LKSSRSRISSIFEHLFEFSFNEEFLRDEALLLQKPAEDKAREQADEAGGASLLTVLLDIHWKFNLWQRPEIPVGEFAVEALVEQFDVEDFLPCRVEGIEVIDW
jgi:hypothetical protein